MPMATLHISDETAKSLAARAGAEGVSVDEMLGRLLRNGIVERAEPRVPVDEFDSILDAESTEAPLLPADFSRADIYADHD